LFPHAIQKPFFSAASTVFEGGGEVRGFGGFIFLAIQGHPSYKLTRNGYFNSEIAVRRSLHRN
jgi:hypothetical protein